MVPAIGLFVGNLLCMCLAVVQSATSRQKARMKSMLSIQAVAEVCWAQCSSKDAFSIGAMYQADGVFASASRDFVRCRHVLKKEKCCM